MRMTEIPDAAVHGEAGGAHDIPIDDALLQHQHHPEQQQQSGQLSGPPQSHESSQGQQQAGSLPPATALSTSNASSLPAAFPKKRRGRPPGRPNTTVRDADYGDNPLVRAWNAAKAEIAVPIVTVGIRDALTEKSLVHETQRAIFRLPSRETIHFVQGWITAKHIASQRPSYVNGLLIHSRGQDADVSCTQCNEKRFKNALGPFVTCRILPGSYHNSCSNCKWFDNTSSCSLYTGPKPNRKRKAKDQLPPPPAAGVGPPSTSDALNGDNPAAAPANGNQTSTQAETKLLDQPQPHQPRQQEPMPHAPSFPKAQPEADMSALQGDLPMEQHTSHPSSGVTNNNPTSHANQSHPISQETHNHSNSLTEPHFAIRVDHTHGNHDGDDDEDSDFVAVQLAAQLLPELHR